MEDDGEKERIPEGSGAKTWEISGFHRRLRSVYSCCDV